MANPTRFVVINIHAGGQDGQTVHLDMLEESVAYKPEGAPPAQQRLKSYQDYVNYIAAGGTAWSVMQYIGYPAPKIGGVVEVGLT
jgi:hypothetical protein